MKFKTLTLLSIFLFSHCATAQTDLIFKASFEFVSKINDTGITWSGEYPSGNLTECTRSLSENRKSTAKNLDLAIFLSNFRQIYLYSPQISEKFDSNQLSLATIPILGQAPSPASNPSPQDCNTGRDVTHNAPTDGHTGFSFTKLDASGVPLVDQSVLYISTQWACVQDNVTGLVWEVKTPSTDVGGIHNQDNTYKWGGITAIGLGHPDASGTYFNDWDELVNGSNAGGGLCGFNDWRVPKVDELSGLENLGRFNPAIETNYFPNTASSGFWSSSPVAGIGNGAWVVGFSYGYGYINDRDNSYRVRLVRSLGE